MLKLKFKFKRVVNGILAVAMLVGTFTAVSYVQPVYAANGNDAWYNPALRWKNTADSRENVLVANAIVGQDILHCSNAECPTNMIWGYKTFVGGEAVYIYPVKSEYEEVECYEYDDDGNISNVYYVHTDNVIGYYTQADEYLGPPDSDETWSKMFYADNGVLAYFGHADKKFFAGISSSTVDDDGKKIGGGNNTGTSISYTVFTTFRVPEYTESGESYYDTRNAVRYGMTYIAKDDDGNPITDRDEAAQYFGVDVTDIVYTDCGVLEVDKNLNACKWSPGYAAVGYISSSDTLIPDAKLCAPVDGGKYTGHHFSANYCNSCGVWGTADNDALNHEINNGAFAINSCAIEYPEEDFEPETDDKNTGTTLYNQANVEATVNRTYSSNAFSEDNRYHQVIDNTVPVCIYCFGTPATKLEQQYHYHKHGTMYTDVKAISDHTIAITKTCLHDNYISQIVEPKRNEAGEIVKDPDTGEIIKVPVDELKNLATDKDKYGVACSTVANQENVTEIDTRGISGCGYQDIDYYHATATVQDYIGVVDGETHYPFFNGVEGSSSYSGSKAENALRAKVTWYTDDGKPPHKLTSGTTTAKYKVTYSLPYSVIYNIEDGNDAEPPEGTETSKYITADIDMDTTVSYTGTATVTLVPQNYADDAEALNPNYTNSNSAYDTLIGNITTPSGATIIGTSGTAGVSSGDFATYDAYEPTWDNVVGDWVIEMGSCDISGDVHKYYKTGRITEDGAVYDIWECVYCHDELYILVGLNATVHTHTYYKYDEIPATCTSKGMIYRRCACGAVDVETTPINAGNHVGWSHRTGLAATCEHDGYEYDECTGCGAQINTTIIPALGHQWTVSSIVQNTGHTPSYIVQTCERCNKSQTISSSGYVLGTSATGAVTLSATDCTAHNYIYKYDLTEDDNTYQIWQCDICGNIEKRLVEATGHHFEYRYTERDCITGTYEIWQCTGCGEIEKRMTESATGHLWVEQSGGVDATCTVPGYKNYICTKCGNTKVEMLPINPNNHTRTLPHYDPAPDCTTPGWEYEQCVACGAYANGGHYVAPLGHNYNVLLDRYKII